ncbi:aspartate--tRNA ligase, chloroplastic/mitochondrial-like [Camellia sinensis]|uniref:aspartate--tRNA ligase, chloroplastic/mitochondrial-like n=1 Tax=Camellia sinensis TaxID=4442 RepID=UPI0010367874|nr:aspartate--tRNA ligase, chloroplastic/mitochondrial-like [Camellia sinensis]XP_028080011.1 aspartate--tRNA ligase, chloroplastic/mitochondrial-like [Camellia sinensis]
MADSAVKMVKAGCQYITVLGVDFMSENVRAILYQAGFLEIGGESLRIYKREIQENVLEIVGISPEQAEAKFGYLLEALDMGALPHVF